MSKVFDTEKYGDYELSIQASYFHYCSPRVDGLPLQDYEKVEVAMWKRGSDFLHPVDIGAPELEYLWNGDDVAGFVAWYDVNRIRFALMKHVESKNRKN